MIPRILLSLGLLLPGAALAEGSDDTNVGGADPQWLDARIGDNPSGSASGSVFTVVFVDILNANEVITFQHTGGVDVFAPGTGTQVGTNLQNNAQFTATTPGAYRVEYRQDQEDWDISVSGTASGKGRVWSRAWHFDAKNYTASAATNASFYALVDGGAPGNDGVVELKTDGLAGYVYLIAANRFGVVNANGRSVPQDANFPTVVVEYPVYLRPPEKANYNPRVPTISAVDFDYDSALCEQVAQGVSEGAFTFTSDVAGTYHIVCDLNDDGVFDFTSDDDLHLIGSTTAGTRRIAWDGTDNRGDQVPPGEYDCEAFVTVGEFHYVGGDIETSYEGFRLFEVPANLARIGLPMYWNDELVMENATTMPNAAAPLHTSGPDGVLSGTYASAAVPNTNARAWGNFNTNPDTISSPRCGRRIEGTTGDTIDDFYICSKGDWAWLDTYTWLRESARVPFPVGVGSLEDSDGDLLLDAEEECLHGTNPALEDTDDDGLSDYDEVYNLPTDPTNPDSDGDGLLDGEEIGPDINNPLNTDPGSPINAMNPDDDGDGIPTAVELADAIRLGDDDPDGDGKPSWLDTDSDGDGIPDSVEGAGDFDEDDWPNYLDLDSDGDTVLDSVEGTTDTDGDGRPDFLDTDDDGDGIPTYDEATQPVTVGDGDYHDTDDNGVPDYLDPDDDGDGIPTIFEGGFDDNFDDDALPNHQDLDSDGDGILDAVEGLLGDDGLPADTDGDGDYDFLDLDSDNDTVLDSVEGTVDTDGDGVPDYRDPDDDGDSIPTEVEVPFGDTDEDEVPDYLDPDDDGDGIPTLTEVQDGALHGNDVDGDGDMNWHDLDSDGDGLSDEEEGRTDTDRDGVPDYLDPDGAYSTYFAGSCVASTAGGPSGAMPWLVALLAASLVRRRRGALAAGLAGAALLTAPDAHALDGPEIAKKTGSAKHVVVLWPRVAPVLGAEVADKMASDVQARLAKLVAEAAPEWGVNVRPRPERACSQSGGCKGPSVGVVVGHLDGGCAVVAYAASPGESPAQLIPWAGVVDFKTPTSPFRAPVESSLVIRDFVDCDQLLDTLDAQSEALRDALRVKLRAAGS